MLITLLMAGLVTAAVLPSFLENMGEEEADIDAPDAIGDVTTTADGAIYDIPAAPGVTTLPAFEQDVDRCVINVTSWDTEFSIEAAEEEGVLLRYGTEDGETVVSFPSLEEMPLGSIDVVIDEGNGTAPVTMSLLQIVEDWDDPADDPIADMPGDVPDQPAGTADPGAVIAPVDPDAPDVLPEPLDSYEPLPPLDPDAPDRLPEPLDSYDPLPPLDPDAPEIDPGSVAASASLAPTPDPLGPDAQVAREFGDPERAAPASAESTLIGDQQRGSTELGLAADGAGSRTPDDEAAMSTAASDIVPGGEDTDRSDVFWLYQDGAKMTGAVADVAGFVSGEDLLKITLNPQIAQGDPDIDVTASADGEDGVVSVGGNVVAILRGAPGAVASDVFVEVRPDMFS